MKRQARKINLRVGLYPHTEDLSQSSIYQNFPIPASKKPGFVVLGKIFRKYLQILKY
jgi:hypothetical protein